MTLLKWFDGYINKPITLRRLAEIAAIALSQAEAELFAESWPEPAEAVGRASPPVDQPQAAPIPADMLVPADLVPANEYNPQDFGTSSHGEGPLVLVVEDHEVNQQLFALTLAKLGYRTVLAEDGIIGVEKALEQTPDIIFMDIQMPRMNGYEAAEELRGMKFSRPIIAVTASAQTDERQRCMEAGFNDILLKPFKRPELEGLLEKWMGGNRGHPTEAGGQTQSGENVIFNPRDLMETFMDNEEIANSLVENFVQRSAEQIETLPALTKEENWQEARRVVHTIKGSSLTLSGKELGNSAGRLELAYKNIDREEMEAAFEPFTEAFARFKNAVEAYLHTK
jgi:CheY-like chemotaxis protein